jgi:hypothetical protein
MGCKNHRMLPLKAKGQEKGEHAFDKRLAVAQELNVGRFVLKINCNGPVFTGWAGCGSHRHPQGRWSMQLVAKDEGNASQFQEDP